MRQTNATLLGLAVGDALGMPFETNKDTVHPAIEKWNGGYMPGNYHQLPPGRWTDDTEMAIALTESMLAAKGYDRRTAADYYCQWAADAPTGMGTSTRHAMDMLRAGISPRDSGTPFDSPYKVGNGTAMRSAPLGVLYDDNTDLLHACQDDAIITHEHRVAEEASYAVALAVSFIIENEGLPFFHLIERLPEGSLIRAAIHKAYDLATDETTTDEKAMEVLGRRGNAIQTVGSAFYFVAAYSPSFEYALDKCIRAGGDTDTRGAIVGAILGTMLGRESIPNHLIRGLYDADYIMGLDDKLMAMRMGDHGA